jgi:hypothetical protein
MRQWYDTDAGDGETPEYVGAFSSPFPTPNDGHQIVAVDWSTRGEVEVTWLIPATD